VNEKKKKKKKKKNISQYQHRRDIITRARQSSVVVSRVFGHEEARVAESRDEFGEIEFLLRQIRREKCAARIRREHENRERYKTRG